MTKVRYKALMPFSVSNKTIVDKGAEVFFVRSGKLIERKIALGEERAIQNDIYNFFFFDDYFFAGRIGNTASVLIKYDSLEETNLDFDLNLPGIQTDTVYYGSTIHKNKPSILTFSFESKTLSNVYPTKYGAVKVYRHNFYLTFFSGELFFFSFENAEDPIWVFNPKVVFKEANEMFLTGYPDIIGEIVVTNVTLDGTNHLVGLKTTTGEVLWQIHCYQFFASLQETIYTFKMGNGIMELLTIEANSGQYTRVNISETVRSANLVLDPRIGFCVVEGYMYLSFFYQKKVAVLNLSTLEIEFVQPVPTDTDWIGSPVVKGDRIYILDERKTYHVFEREY